MYIRGTDFEAWKDRTPHRQHPDHGLLMGALGAAKEHSKVVILVYPKITRRLFGPFPLLSFLLLARTLHHGVQPTK